MLAKPKYIGITKNCSGLIGAKNTFYNSSIRKSERNPLLIKIKTFTIQKGLAFKAWFLKKQGKNAFYLGFIRAYSLPTLPAKLELFYNNIFVRIFRFIGGLAFLLIVTKTYLILPKFT